MNEVQKMFQTIVNGQSAMKGELLQKIEGLDEKLSGKIDALDKKIDNVDQKLTKRLDMIGRQLAYLEDDTPTKEEFEELEKRMGKLEGQMAVA